MHFCIKYIFASANLHENDRLFNVPFLGFAHCLGAHNTPGHHLNIPPRYLRISDRRPFTKSLRNAPLLIFDGRVYLKNMSINFLLHFTCKKGFDAEHFACKMYAKILFCIKCFFATLVKRSHPGCIRYQTLKCTSCNAILFLC